MRTLKVIAVTLVPALVVGGFASGCASTAVVGDAAPTAGTAKDCHGEAATSAGGRAFVAVLVAPGGSPTPDSLHSAFSTVTAGAKRMQARLVLAGVVQGHERGAAPVDETLVPEGPNALMREHAIRCRGAALENGYRRIVRGGFTGEPDEVSALGALASDLKAIPHGQNVDVVLLGSALDRTVFDGARAIDLSSPATLREPAKTIDALAKAGLNFRCQAWRVSIVGGGIGPAGRPLGSVEAVQLEQFWALYFQHCGGSLISYSSELGSFPVGGSAIPPPDFTTVPISIKRSKRVVVATLSSSVLFAPGSPALQAGAHGVLRKLVRLATRARGTISIAGFTDDSGNDAINIPLSQARAGAVAVWLERHTRIRAARISVHGYGSRLPVASNATASGQGRNRRVVVTVRL